MQGGDPWTLKTAPLRSRRRVVASRAPGPPSRSIFTGSPGRMRTGRGGASTTGVASLAWTGLFREAGECYEAFERVASEDGIASFSDSQIVRHGPCLPSRSGGLNGEAISGVSECARGHRSAGYPTA